MKELSYILKIEMIDEVKKYFEKQLEKKLMLKKVQCPLFVRSESGLQDYLSGVEKSVSFKIDDLEFEIVHSLAKWKREALALYQVPLYHGIYTDMKAIRTHETIDCTHSYLVEQWDWEMVISKSDRTIKFLKHIVRKIYSSLMQTLKYIKTKYPFITLSLPASIYFITSQELEDMYKDKTPKQREEIITKKMGAVFIIGIGDKLKSGMVHDLRSPDYDDWSLDGDLLVYDEVLGKSIELSSMGIRVDEKSLVSQLLKSSHMERLKQPYHKHLKEGKLPYTIGGGIGISRVLMLLLKQPHIALVQPSQWDYKTLEELKDMKIM